MQPGYPPLVLRERQPAACRKRHAAWVPAPAPPLTRVAQKRGLQRAAAGHLEEVRGRAVDGQRVVKVVRGVELAPARGVRQRLVRLLDRLEALLDGRLLLLARRRRAGLVGVVLQRRAPVAWPRARARTSGRALSFSLSWRSAGVLATTGMSAAPAATAAQLRAPVQPGDQRRQRDSSMHAWLAPDPDGRSDQCSTPPTRPPSSARLPPPAARAPCWQPHRAHHSLFAPRSPSSARFAGRAARTGPPCRWRPSSSSSPCSSSLSCAAASIGTCQSAPPGCTNSKAWGMQCLHIAIVKDLMTST